MAFAVAMREGAMLTAVPPFMPHGRTWHPTPVFSEPLCLLEWFALRLAPLYYGVGIPRGDGSAVVVIPGFIGTDVYLYELYAWLTRIGYKPYYSGVGLMAVCPNKLSMRLEHTIGTAYRETGRRVHLVGHSLGGVFARVTAARSCRRIASVISLGTPFRGAAAHGVIHKTTDVVRSLMRAFQPELPSTCGTSRCDCPFVRSLTRPWPESVIQTSVFSKQDGLVHWPYCLSGREGVDVEVSGTHIGMTFSAEVYQVIAKRLALAQGG